MSERRIVNDGVELFCSDQGSGRPVLLIHAAGADSTTWGDIATTLRSRCRVIAYDRRGYSRSSPAGKPTLAQHGTDAAAILERLECGPAVVVALSAGATIALQLAVSRPELVTGMVLHEPPFHGKRHPSVSAIGAIIRMQRLAKGGRVADAAESFMRWAYAYPDTGSAYDKYPDSWREVARANAASTVHDVAAIATGESVSRRQLELLSIPVVCTAGALSRAANRKAMQRLTAWLPNASLAVIAGAAHEVVLDNPAAIAQHALAVAESDAAEDGASRRIASALA